MVYKQIVYCTYLLSNYTTLVLPILNNINKNKNCLKTIIKKKVLGS